MRKLTFVILLLLSKVNRIKDNVVFFDSFNGQYNDNPRYISEELHLLRPDLSIVWCVSDKGNDLPPTYVKCVEFRTNEYYDYAMNSSVVVDNNIGIRTFGFKTSVFKLFGSLLHKKGQLCISTWHGTPIKYVGKDQISKEGIRYYTSTDYLISGSEYNSSRLSHAFDIPKNKIKNYGMPRTDLLFRKVDRNTILEKLELPKDKKIVLFAPTFRDSINSFEKIISFDVRRILVELEKKYNEKFVFVYRVHHTVLGLCNSSNFEDDCYINGNKHDDMAEYLYVADVLITDYSGSMFDFAHTLRPCLLFCPDYEHYKNIERGLYIDITTLPFPISYTKDELYETIHSFDSKQYLTKVEKWEKEIGNYDIGNASKRTAELIIRHLAP